MIYVNIDDIDDLRPELDDLESRISQLENDLDKVFATLNAGRR